ncbi:MAG: bifunctional diaminohydroxyphosphoribosylaminopyrimidine deaminase/5-amino-6-(5-phosphoribosylamino)uracil reductase RibD [Gemmatimonadota bacterium]
MMARALELARRGRGRVSPNPLVGAVLAHGELVVGEGWHAELGAAHAEAAAISAAGERARGATMYVTLEPCTHQGRTPPCADAIIAAGVRRIVVAVADPNPVAAGGMAQLGAAGVECTKGVLQQEAAELNASFMHHFASGGRRPWITLKMAVSLDAAIADATGTTTRVTGPAARIYAHELRAASDAVAVGMNTVHIDDPQLTVRDVPAPRVPPRRVVFTRSGNLPERSRLAGSAREAPVTVLVIGAGDRSPAVDTRGVQTVHSATLDDALRYLADTGVRSMLVEGGAGVAASLLDAGLVDRLILIQAPIVFGRGACAAFGLVEPATAARLGRLRIISRLELDDDVATTWAVREL